MNGLGLELVASRSFVDFQALELRFGITKEQEKRKGSARCCGQQSQVNGELPYYLLVEFDALFESFEENRLGLTAVSLGNVRLLEGVFDLSVNVLTCIELVLQKREQETSSRLLGQSD